MRILGACEPHATCVSKMLLQDFTRPVAGPDRDLVIDSDGTLV